MPKPRSASIDAVRVVGIFAVVVAHTWDGPIVHALFFNWVVPVFFFLSGYLWTPGRSMRMELDNRWRTLAVPYLFWLGVIGVAYLGSLAYRGAFSLERVARILEGGNHIARPFSAFWFMSALFVACVLFRLLERWPVAIVALAVAGLVATWAAPERVASIWLSAGIAVPSLIFMVAGLGFRAVKNRLPALLPLALVGMLISAVLIALGWARGLDMKQGDFGTPVVSVVVAIVVCAALVVVSDRVVPLLGRRIGQAITMLAMCGTMVILTHAAVLWILEAPVENAPFIDFFLALTIPWAAALLIARTPLSPLMIGTPRVRSTSAVRQS